MAFDFCAPLCHPFRVFLPFGFWFLGISFPFVLFWVWFPASEVLALFDWFGFVSLVWTCRLVWACRHLLQTAQAKTGSASSKVPHPTCEPLGKNFKWLVNIHLWSNNKENGLKILDAYCHRMWKWTEVPLYPRLFSYNQQSGADQTKTLTVPEGQ